MTKRMNFVVPDDFAERMEHLKELTSASSSAEVIRRAIQLYEEMLTQTRNGGDFLFRNSPDSKPERYQPFGGL